MEMSGRMYMTKYLGAGGNIIFNLKITANSRGIQNEEESEILNGNIFDIKTANI